MKLWEKGYDLDKKTEEFTIGNDRLIDLDLAKYDIIGSLAHIKMLLSIHILNNDEYQVLRKKLIQIYNDVNSPNSSFQIETEDIHSQIELILTNELGDLGKKIHTARSRNDQVLLDIYIFSRDKIKQIVTDSENLFNLLIQLSNVHKDTLMPGYTHLQVAMPSSFGLWFGSYAECLVDDMSALHLAYKMVNQNPLGSAAGYGSSIPIDRQLTTELLGFDDLIYNSAKAQLGRSKIEETIAFSLSSVVSTLAKFSSDVCLFTSQNFEFVSFPDEFTTGSSIMPHKKNPDIFELVRAKSNKIKTLQFQISQLTGNLTSGYFRDYQIVKGLIIPAFDEVLQLIDIIHHAIKNIKINKEILNDDKYKYLYSVENVNQLVQQGVPFRDAYKIIAKEIDDNVFKPLKNNQHTHIGSVGNLCNDQIVNKMKSVTKQFDFEKIEEKINNLLDSNL
jgi:argininosuccinate lyase